MKLFKIVIIFYSLYIISSLNYAFNIPTNNRLVLRLINHSTKTLAYAGVAKMNVGNTFFISPNVIFPGGAATIIGTATPYADLAGKIYFHDNTNYNHLLYIIDPRMINFKKPTFSIQNEKLISFVKPASFIKNENQSPSSIAYTSTTVTIEDNVKALAKKNSIS
jgi:hypothetical protein